MRRSRSKRSRYVIKRPWLYGAVGLLAFIFATVNCTLDHDYAFPANTSTSANQEAEITASTGLDGQEMPQDKSINQKENQSVLAEMLWAEVTEDVISPAPTSPDRISVDVRDANMLDVLSMLAYKMDGNVLYLEDPRNVTFKTEALLPITTLQLLLQKEGLDYLTIGSNYIVGERERLYGDFTNRMFLTRFNLFYVSANAMEGYINELGMPVESLTIDHNQKALWMQGTPMTLGKAREIINSLDVIDNAAFAEGGGRKIRMPVAQTTGNRAEEELQNLISLLSILLDGFRDDRADMGWVTWDHPDPVPRIYMDWESPVIKPYDIKMKISPDLDSSFNNQLRFLIAEGTPDNIELINQMIDAISDTRSSPFGLTDVPVDDPDHEPAVNNAEEEVVPDPQGDSFLYFSVTLKGVPPEAGNLSGAGSFSQGSTVTVSATAQDGYEFVRWIEGGAEVSTRPTFAFNIYSDRALEAVFISTNSGSDSETVENDFDQSEQ